MRKRMFFVLIASLCVAEFAALAAVSQRGRGVSNTPPATDTTKASTARSAVKKDTPSVSKGRSATKPVVAARAGTTQKAINTGTKVAGAAENTAIPQECQDNFFGCMDAFCMLDNASGGRCQCSNKITEYDAVLEDILKLDEQSYVMATEGVERIKMGEAESQILARAKAAGEKAVADSKDDKNDKSKLARKLDLSVFDNNIFTDTDNIFGDSSEGDVSTFASKKGDELYQASAKMCAAQIPAKCKNYNSMLQLVYAQRIKSDCMAYENSLKAQKSQSQQKLQTAQKALRDAALEEYNEQNRYGTVGECAVAFAQCMQTTAECGEDYTGCVTLAAKENVKSTRNGAIAKQQKIKGTVKGADITLAASTMEQLLSKKPICERITKQCVNANKNDAVWNTFLRNAAPALKSAEEIAEQKLRMECIPTITKCFQTACKSNFGEGDSYDMCLSNPATYKSLCKVQLEPCLEATGGSYTNLTDSSLWNGILAALNAMKVDACTKEVRDCLTSDNACGADYSACIGLSADAIMKLCPEDKLTACKTANDSGSYGDDNVMEYVYKVAQGIALQIDSNMQLACENALDSAMEKYCGDKQSCPNISLLSSTITNQMRAQVCTEDGKECHDSPSVFKVADLLKGDILVKVRGPEMSQIAYNDGNPGKDVFKLYSDTSKTTDEFDSSEFKSKDIYTLTKQTVDMLNTAWNSKIAQIESDPKVKACMTGRDFDKFGKSNDKTKARYPNLTQSARMNIADDLVKRFSSDYSDAAKKINDEKVPVLAEELAKKIEKEVGSLEDALDVSNKAICDAYTHIVKLPIAGAGGDKIIEQKTATYNATTNECVIVIEKYQAHWYKNPNRKTCPTISLGTCEYVKIGTETQKIKPGEGGLKDVSNTMDSVNSVVEGTSGGGTVSQQPAQGRGNTF